VARLTVYRGPLLLWVVHSCTLCVHPVRAHYSAIQREESVAMRNAMRLTGAMKNNTNKSGGGQFLTLAAVARVVGFHPVTLRRWKIPGRVVGRRRRFLESEVREWLLKGGGR
jgi:hypothetical protein